MQNQQSRNRQIRRQLPLQAIGPVGLGALDKVAKTIHTPGWRQRRPEDPVDPGPAIPGAIVGKRSKNNWKLIAAFQPIDGLEIPNHKASAALRLLVGIYRMVKALAIWDLHEKEESGFRDFDANVVNAKVREQFGKFQPKFVAVDMDEDGLFWPTAQFWKNYRARIEKVCASKGAVLPWRQEVSEEFYNARIRDIETCYTAPAEHQPSVIHRRIAAALEVLADPNNWILFPEASGFRLVGSLLPNWNKDDGFPPRVMPLTKGYGADRKVHGDLVLWRVGMDLDEKSQGTFPLTEFIKNPLIVEGASFVTALNVACAKAESNEQSDKIRDNMFRNPPAETVLQNGERLTQWVPWANELVMPVLRDTDMTEELVSFAQKAGLELNFANMEELQMKTVDPSILWNIGSIIAEAEAGYGLDTLVREHNKLAGYSEAPEVGDLAQDAISAPEGRFLEDIVMDDVDFSPAEKAAEFEALAAQGIEKRQTAFVAGLGDEENEE